MTKRLTVHLTPVTSPACHALETGLARAPALLMAPRTPAPVRAGVIPLSGRIRRTQRLGGLVNEYQRAA